MKVKKRKIIGEKKSGGEEEGYDGWGEWIEVKNRKIAERKEERMIWEKKENVSKEENCMEVKRKRKNGIKKTRWKYRSKK